MTKTRPSARRQCARCQVREASRLLTKRYESVSRWPTNWPARRRQVVALRGCTACPPDRLCQLRVPGNATTRIPNGVIFATKIDSFMTPPPRLRKFYPSEYRSLPETGVRHKHSIRSLFSCQVSSEMRCSKSYNCATIMLRRNNSRRHSIEAKTRSFYFPIGNNIFFGEFHE